MTDESKKPPMRLVPKPNEVETGKYVAIHENEAAIVLRNDGRMEVHPHAEDNDAAKAAHHILKALGMSVGSPRNPKEAP